MKRPKKKKLVSDFEILERFESNPKSEGFAILIENLLTYIWLLEEDDLVRTSNKVWPEEPFSNYLATYYHTLINKVK